MLLRHPKRENERTFVGPPICVVNTSPLIPVKTEKGYYLGVIKFLLINLRLQNIW